MIFTHGANSLPRGGGGMTVNIGGRDYPVVQIGNQLWLAENLDFKFPGLVVGARGTSSSELRGNYYDNDESTYGASGNKYGLLYNWPAIKYLNDHRADLIPGWHVSTDDEWATLATAVGGTSVAGTKLKSTTDWSSGAGTDDYGFSAFPAGRYNDTFNLLYDYAYFWTDTDVSDGPLAKLRYFDSSVDMKSTFISKSSQFSVRLVKDA